ncbi:MAG TPA: LodA/GoxA family CTQ-dependent oxidase [Candidatus Angelobacter sp.]|nr:LodA/GoxA family CTQ-dependent oxidase [Candidatus Angelobacter sp.]
MAIKSVKIHPSIGIARLGNSPTDFFIGPEIPLDHTPPAGGYKDASCRVKRQAARFRLFGYDQNGNLVKELTAADADITWTVHLCNKKASTPARNSAVTGSDRAGLVIDPGPRTLNGPTQQAKFDTGVFQLPGKSPVSVPLGEVRTDVNGRLLVLGGFGTSKSPTGKPIGDFLNNDEWFDDVSDGPVTATVKLKSDGSTPPVTGSWVFCPPPKFAPALDSVITLYDRIFDLAVQQGWLAAPATPSYSKDIYPILNRATTTAAVNQSASGHHGFVHPVTDQTTRNMIFQRLKPAGDMPDLNSAQLTPTQRALMSAWNNGNFNNDWAGVPVPSGNITPDGMDRAALEACVGMAFFPGIEAGGIAATPIIDATLYLEPFRLDHTKVNPGDMTANMACPWQADFTACGSNWWPVPRPNQVIQQNTGTYQEWWTGSWDLMVTDWSTLGFVVQQGGSFVEVERCDTPSITLVTPALNFQDVPQGPSGMSRKQALAVVFEVESKTAAVTFQFQSGPTFARLQRLTSTPVVVGPTAPNAIVPARLWITYETGAVGEIVADSVTVLHVESGKTWTIPITANTVARKTAAAALVLDHSGSMIEDRGDGVSKIQSLREAASIFIDVMLEGDGASIVRFNQTADLLAPVTTLGSASDPFDTGRTTIKNIISSNQLDPGGSTSIGAGIVTGRQALNAAPAFDVDSLLVLTDGMENTAPFIADVASQINEFTYSVGLGKPENISVAALQAISGNHGGYLLITGAISGDNRFLLQKYFLQILAGISNAEIVLDPQGTLVPGKPQTIPFQMTEADAGMDVILLTPYPEYVNFRIKTPIGFTIDPSTPALQPYIQFVRSRGVSYYRLSLPVELSPLRFEQGGTWQVLLDIGKPAGVGRTVSNRPSRTEEFQQQQAGSFASREGGLPFSVVVHSYSNLSMRAGASQTSYEPGATVHLNATLAESGAPMKMQATVWAEVTAPDGHLLNVNLHQDDQGLFTGKFIAATPGVYRARVRAAGKSLRGFPFRREQTVTAAVWVGGNTTGGPGGSPGDKLCHFLNCIFGEKGVITGELAQLLRRLGFDINALRRCLAECHDSRIPENERAAQVSSSTATSALTSPSGSSLSTSAIAMLEQFLKNTSSGGSQ